MPTKTMYALSCLRARSMRLQVMWAFCSILMSYGKIHSRLDKVRALAKAEDLRNRERTAFEAVITDKAREVFDAP